MSDLILSRRDINFLLYEWLQVDALCERARYTGHDHVGFDATLDVYESLARDLFEPHNKKNDSAEPHWDGDRVAINAEVGIALKALAEAGLFASGMPESWGGANLPSVVERAGTAFLVAANISTTGYAYLTIANANLLIAHASSDQCERYVRPMAAGRWFGTMCLSEPQAGSSLADIRTRAVPDRDGRYRLFGNKMWISAGEHEISENIVHLVLAKIPDESGHLPPGVKGISLFIVPRRLLNADGTPGERNDVVLAGINHKMGYRGTVNCLLNFGEGVACPEGVPGAIGELVGQPGQGLAQMFHMMNDARISVGLGAAALAYTGYLHALDYARTRKQGRLRGSRNPASEQTPIIDHPDVRRMLLAQKAYASGSLALCLYVSRLSDDAASLEDPAARREAGLLFDLMTPIAKSWPSQWGLAGNDLAIQVHGGYGYTREYNVEQFYRDNRLNAIHEGTFGIQALDLLGRKVRLDGGAGLVLLSSRVASTCARASLSQTLAGQAKALQSYWDRIVAVTAALNEMEDRDAQLANSAPYLEAFGHVVVGWLWLDQAVCAQTAIAGTGGSDVDFYRGKLAACNYYFGWELPKVPAWLSVLSPVERTPLDAHNEWL